MLPLSTEEKKQQLCTPTLFHVPQDQKLFKELDYASKHIIVNRDALEGEQENLKWEGVTGSLTPAIERKLDSLKLTWMRCPIGFEFSTSLKINIGE